MVVLKYQNMYLMDKMLEDLLNISNDSIIEIEEKEEKERYEFFENPERFSLNCKCIYCRSVNKSD